MRVVPYCGNYVLGGWHGERHLDWLEQRGPTGRLTAVLERLLARAAGVVVLHQRRPTGASRYRRR